MSTVLIILGMLYLVSLVIIYFMAKNAHKAYTKYFKLFQEYNKDKMEGWDLLFQEEAFNLWLDKDISQAEAIRRRKQNLH